MLMMNYRKDRWLERTINHIVHDRPMVYIYIYTLLFFLLSNGNKWNVLPLTEMHIVDIICAFGPGYPVFRHFHFN